MLENGKRQKMSDLKVGDSVLSVDTNGHHIFSPVILFLHRSPEVRSQFHEIQTEAGHSITLTPSHLIYTKYRNEDQEYLNTMINESRINLIANHLAHKEIETFQVGYASNVKEGDFVLVFDTNHDPKPSRVLNVKVNVQSCVYAPLTLQGNLVVDDVLASCYAVMNNHAMAHLSFSPFRWWYHIKTYLPYSGNGLKMGNDLNDDGIHWYANDLYSLVKTIDYFKTIDYYQNNF